MLFRSRASLETAFGQFTDWQAKTEKMNKTDMRYGFGRLDAVGHIFNKVLMFAGADARLGHASDAPVSYPFLWGISDQEHVQWNGIARNSRFELPGRALEYGALGRNTGEVLGVFGEVLLVPGNPLKGYASSVRVESLDSMEQLVKVLEAPRWPAHFPPIDTALAAKGETLFDSDCVACHTKPQARPAAAPTERMISFEATLARNPADLTDIWMACNAFVHDGPTGPLEGSKDLDGKPFGPTASVARMLGASARGAILGKKADLVTVVFRTFFGVPSLPPVERAFDPNDPRADDRATCKQTPDTPVLGYKARPLDGIWATAPYLHNGSVASLYELLLPPDKRMAAFWVGSRAFDPVKVGYATTDPGGGQGFLLNTRTADGRPLDGNSNAGHDYGAARLTEADRMALIEYLKTE